MNCPSASSLFLSTEGDQIFTLSKIDPTSTFMRYFTYQEERSYTCSFLWTFASPQTEIGTRVQVESSSLFVSYPPILGDRRPHSLCFRGSVFCGPPPTSGPLRPRDIVLFVVDTHVHPDFNRLFTIHFSLTLFEVTYTVPKQVHGFNDISPLLFVGRHPVDVGQVSPPRITTVPGKSLRLDLGPIIRNETS